MSSTVFLLSFILSIPVLSEGGSKPPIVNIGAIISSSSSVGRVSKIAMEVAADDVNSDPSFLEGTKFQITFHDARRSGFLSIMGALKFMETDTVAIIGPQTSIMAHVLSHLANELQVPLLSFTALDPTMQSLQYPYFVQTAPNDVFLMTGIAEIISHYGWSDVVAIYNDDDQNRNSVIELGDKLGERLCRISYKAALPLDLAITSPDSVMNELIKIQKMESRVIVVSTFTNTGFMVFKLAQKLGMMGRGYVWIATPWLSAELESNWPLPLKTVESLRGVLTLRPHTPESKRKRDFVARWNKVSNGSIGLNTYGLYAYDTVWIIAQALRLFLNNGNTISFSNNTKMNKDGDSLNLGALSVFDEGRQLLKNVLQTKMVGLTGPIQFTPDKSMVQPSYDIINVVGEGYKRIGYWSNHSGLSVLPPETFYGKPPNRSSSSQRLSSIVWPGGTTEIPRGWHFPNNGRRLRIGVPDRTSYKDVVSRINGTDKMEGFCIDVFLAAIKLLPYAVPFTFIPFGDGRKNPNYNELVNKVSDGDFDAAVGDISIVRNRTKIVDFTQPYMESGLVVVARVRKQNSNAWAFLRPFTPEMWAITGLFFMAVGAVIWLLEHRINDEFRGPPKNQIITVFWFSFSTMFFSHRENTMSTLGRIVLLIWLFVVLIINSSYTASLTSILTVEKLSSPIDGIDTLITSDLPVGVQAGSFAGNYLSEELNIAKSRLVALGSPQEYASALKNGTVAAIVEERTYVDLFFSDYCSFAIRGQEFTRRGWGFAFPRDSPLAIDMSTAILSLSETGQLQEIRNRWLSKANCSSWNGSDAFESEQLHLQSFWGLFIICGIISSIAVIAYICRLLRQFGRRVPEDAVNSSGGLVSGRVQTFLAFVDEKKDESKRKISKRKRNEMSSNGN